MYLKLVIKMSNNNHNMAMTWF